MARIYIRAHFVYLCILIEYFLHIYSIFRIFAIIKS
nr:MAG TPA: hypothetical protein [Bacteriophage sp.]